ncbi:MAG: hypothetical protein HY661_03440 [Betaproteobacteria bacterium]|nr:hypothetical protein [Betaproteobacteria bacterium]
MTGSIDFPFPKSKPLAIALGAGMVVLIALADYLTGFEFDLSILYIVPVGLISWKLGRTSGILFAVIAAAAWLANQQLTGHLLPHAFLLYPHSLLHLWKAVILLATWIVFVILLENLKIALARADERFATVLEGLEEAVYVVNPQNGDLLYMNQRCRDEFEAGAPLTGSQQIESRLQTVSSKESGGEEYFDSARERWFRIHTRKLRWVDGRSVVLKVASNITERKRAEELNRRQQQKLQLTSRLVTVGGMASTLAHEINQPLAAIVNYNMGCVRRLRAGNWNPQELLAAMERAGAQAERAGRIIHRVRELVRKGKPEPLPCDINGMILDIATLIEIDAEKDGVRIRLDLVPELPPVPADKVMLEQAILNIARNGIDSMQETPREERELTIRSRLDPSAGAIAIEIADTGCGIPESMVGNSFEPFFTTKPEGLGVGLNLCRSIVESHHGRLWASRNPERGSTFHFSLPLHQS